MWTRRLILIVMAAGVFGMLGVGCGSRGSTPSSSGGLAYPDAYKTLMMEYKGRMMELTSRPPPPASTPKEQKRTTIAQQVEEMADTHAEFANKLRALKPPPEFVGVHDATVAVFEAGDGPNRRWAEAIRTGNREARDRTMEEAETAQAQALIRLNQALEQAGGSSEKLRALAVELQGATGR
jgi:hypothetical protein